MEKGIPQDSQQRRKGGIRTLPFIIANEALEKVPSIDAKHDLVFEGSNTIELESFV
ncbi:hypothetical protein CCACVL1_27891 [Corchorus capsularis]|uniref:Uncharacterized protein n=1 Tax=Corchorus capsularis TaxID=210143 RepID=A0A1R3G892_COCAP|nr:hypothetical protein CCACVL1_27891 [Corchorus capsularis]